MDSLYQLNLAMQYIEENIMEDIDCASIARIACCSEYHFKRIFSFLAGMPISEYIRKRKLSYAVNLLKTSNKKVIDIAILLGYESGEAFTKAFNTLHNVSPSEARRNSVTLKVFPPMTFQLTIQGGNIMNYRIEELGEFKIAGVGKRGTLVYNGVNTQISDMISHLKPEDFVELKQLCNMHPDGILNVSTNFSDNREDGSELDQYIGVATTLSVPERWNTLRVEALTWAVFTCIGKFPDELQNTWARIYSEWLPTSGYEVIQGPEMLWNESPDTNNPDYKSEIWIPVIKKS